MKNTTLVYIEKDGCYLMLLRNKKKNDLNEGKWIGVGGHFEENESPEECMIREVREETNLRVTGYRYRAIVTFVSDRYEGEYMHLFTVSSFEGELKECNEGELRWIPKEDVFGLNLWVGDRTFLRYLLEDRGFFTMKLTYEGDDLVDIQTHLYDEETGGKEIGRMITITAEHFDLRQIVDSGQCFRMTDLGAGEYELISRDRYLRLKQERNRISFACSQEEYEQVWRPYFDLDIDYGEFISRINPRDTFLVKAAEYGSGMRILRQDLWETMVTFLISQQNNLPRIRRCITLLCEKYGDLCRTEEGTGYYAFPAPEKLAGLPEDGLLSCNLGYRSKYVVRTAADIISGKTDLEKIRSASPAEAKEELMKCFGVGEKVAECICLFSLHHLDAFPVDTHIRKVLDEHYKRGFPNRRYKGFRGVIQQYLFYYDLKQGMAEGE